MNIKNWIDAFILERRSRNFSTDITDHYQRELEDFEVFASLHNVNAVSEITADLVRAYILHLAKRYTTGGLRVKFQALRTFLKWYSLQSESDGWENPIKKIKLPKETSAPIK